MVFSCVVVVQEYLVLPRSRPVWDRNSRISLSAYKNEEYVGHQKIKAKHMFRNWMCWSEHSLPQRVIGGYTCSSKTGDFLRKIKPLWIESLTKAWGKSLGIFSSKRMTPTETARVFLYSRVCAVCEWEMIVSPGKRNQIWRWTIWLHWEANQVSPSRSFQSR